MQINKNKSGILTFFRESPLGIHKGYPQVQQYKYLGMWVDSNLDLTHHLKSINTKFGYINNRLYPIRAKKSLKLNRNLFLTFITPLYRLAFTLTNTKQAK
jgi:hypothetical protein